MCVIHLFPFNTYTSNPFSIYTLNDTSTAFSAYTSVNTSTGSANFTVQYNTKILVQPTQLTYKKVIYENVEKRLLFNSMYLLKTCRDNHFQYLLFN